MPDLIELKRERPASLLAAPSLLAARVSRLSLLAAEIESRHAGARYSAASRRDAFVLRTARKLAESGGDLSQLDSREHRAALYAFWRRDVWPARAADVQNWLRWAESEWRPRIAETTALGAAYAAGLAVGYWQGRDDLRGNWGVEKRWQPRMTEQQRSRLYGSWQKALSRCDWKD